MPNNQPNIKVSNNLIDSNNINGMTHVPLTQQLAENPKIKIAKNTNEDGILIGQRAMIAAGIQPEFLAANMLQAQHFNCSIILRAGDPPQYNKLRSPKSGLNLSKTSKQGFFKGAIAEEQRFSRIEAGKPVLLNKKDLAHLNLSPLDPNYQHRKTLDINMQDILREVGEKGDLHVLGYNQNSNQLRLTYKPGKGPDKNDFNGQFVIDLNAGTNSPIFYARDWDKPENDPNWDKQNKIISKPDALADVPDEVYQAVFNHSFDLYFTEHSNDNPLPSELKAAKVFANRAQSIHDFKQAIGPNDPLYNQLKNCKSIPQLFEKIKTYDEPGFDAEKYMLNLYDKTGSIVAGDWDGLALGHPLGLNARFTEVINTFDEESKFENIDALFKGTEAYINHLKTQAFEKHPDDVTAFERKILALPPLEKVVSHFSLERAGCITIHEFAFQQILNHAYRDEMNTHYGEKYDFDTVQTAMDQLLQVKSDLSDSDVPIKARDLLEQKINISGQPIPEQMIEKLTEHMTHHFNKIKANGGESYPLPHFQHDLNVRDLYQHGFDTRNPYGSNFEGAWLLATDKGEVIYGKTETLLTEVMLTGDFLEKNLIDISHGADLSKGWRHVIEKQIALGQKIPPLTLKKYHDFQNQEQKKSPFIASSEKKNTINQFLAFKKECVGLKNNDKKVTSEPKNTPDERVKKTFQP